MRNLEFDEEQFFKYTRMTKKQFAYLHQLTHPYIQKNPKRKHICSEQRLIMTLHYLSEGCSMQEIAWNYRVGRATARNIIKENCQVLWDILSPRELPSPTIEDFYRISEEFFKRWNVPNCIGAVDGKHINICAPKNSGSEYFNYKKSFSLVLMATCDANYRFIMVDIGAEGSNHDSSIFKNSSFGLAFLKGQLEIPPPRTLPMFDTVFPHFIIGDSAFPLHENIIRPYPGSHLGEKKKIFNYRISRARRTIESTFGILSARWRILRRPIQASVEVSELIVQATVVLHNFVQKSESNIPAGQKKYCPPGFVDSFDDNGDFHPGRWRDNGQLKGVVKLGSNNATNKAKQQRDVLSDYFVSPEGSVPWQEMYVHRGAVPL